MTCRSGVDDGYDVRRDYDHEPPEPARSTHPVARPASRCARSRPPTREVVCFFGSVAHPPHPPPRPARRAVRVRCAAPAGRPSRSKSMARELVVPWSRERMYFNAATGPLPPRRSRPAIRRCATMVPATRNAGRLPAVPHIRRARRDRTSNPACRARSRPGNLPPSACGGCRARGQRRHGSSVPVTGAGRSLRNGRPACSGPAGVVGGCRR